MERRGTEVGMTTSRKRLFADQHLVARGRAGVPVDAEPGRGVALGIEIDDQHPLADRGERGAEIDGGGRLADAALLVRHGENARTRRGVGLANEGGLGLRVSVMGVRSQLRRMRRIAAFGSTTLGSVSIA